MLRVGVLMKTCADSNKLAEASVNVRIWLFSDPEDVLPVTFPLGIKVPCSAPERFSVVFVVFVFNCCSTLPLIK